MAPSLTRRKRPSADAGLSSLENPSSQGFAKALAELDRQADYYDPVWQWFGRIQTTPPPSAAIVVSDDRAARTSPTQKASPGSNGDTNTRAAGSSTVKASGSAAQITQPRANKSGPAGEFHTASHVVGDHGSADDGDMFANLAHLTTGQIFGADHAVLAPGGQDPLSSAGAAAPAVDSRNRSEKAYALRHAILDYLRLPAQRWPRRWRGRRYKERLWMSSFDGAVLSSFAASGSPDQAKNSDPDRGRGPELESDASDGKTSKPQSPASNSKRRLGEFDAEHLPDFKRRRQHQHQRSQHSSHASRRQAYPLRQDGGSEMQKAIAESEALEQQEREIESKERPLRYQEKQRPVPGAPRNGQQAHETHMHKASSVGVADLGTRDAADNSAFSPSPRLPAKVSKEQQRARRRCAKETLETSTSPYLWPFLQTPILHNARRSTSVEEARESAARNASDGGDGDQHSVAMATETVESGEPSCASSFPSCFHIGGSIAPPNSLAGSVGPSSAVHASDTKKVTPVVNPGEHSEEDASPGLPSLQATAQSQPSSPQWGDGLSDGADDERGKASDRYSDRRILLLPDQTVALPTTTATTTLTSASASAQFILAKSPHAASASFRQTRRGHRGHRRGSGGGVSGSTTNRRHHQHYLAKPPSPDNIVSWLPISGRRDRDLSATGRRALLGHYLHAHHSGLPTIRPWASNVGSPLHMLYNNSRIATSLDPNLALGRFVSVAAAATAARKAAVALAQESTAQHIVGHNSGESEDASDNDSFVTCQSRMSVSA